MTAVPAPPGTPERAWAAAFGALPLGPKAMLELLDRAGAFDPDTNPVAAARKAWELAAAGGGSRDKRTALKLRMAAGRWDPARQWDYCQREGIWAHVYGESGYPEALAADPEPPAVLFGKGDPACLAGPTVAIIGARNCTAYGRTVARRFGRDLATAGVSVISGLALGIDGAAHEGALEAGPSASPPVGVVGSGLDVVYPDVHRRLWQTVATRGCLLAEAPPGAIPEPWRFPARNRIIAALADVVVVVEAHPASGTRHTIDAAIDRGVRVMAVPGPVGSQASTGANQLLREGCAPACDIDDVLMAVGLERAGSRGIDLRTPPEAADAALLDQLEWTPTSIEVLTERTGLAIGSLMSALLRLEEGRWAASKENWWHRADPV